MTSKVLGTLLCAALVFAAAPSSGAGECSCKDRRDLLNRLREANAAIQAYQAEIANISAREASTGKEEKFSRDAYFTQVQPAVQAALDRVTDSGSNRATGSTNTGICKVEVDPLMKNGQPVTACLRKSIEEHEAWHARACRDKMPYVLSDYRNGERLAAVAEEEIVAYRREAVFALSQLEETMHDCRFELELDSVIDSPAYQTRSEAHAKIPMSFDAACNCFTGSGMLSYKTGPNGSTAHDLYYLGQGDARFEVARAEIHEDMSGRYVRLLFNMDLTREAMMSWSRGPLPIPAVGFWAPQFIISRGNKPAVDGGYLVTDWHYGKAGDPVYADAVLQGNCAGNCTETTKLVVRQQ